MSHTDDRVPIRDPVGGRVPRICETQDSGFIGIWKSIFKMGTPAKGPDITCYEELPRPPSIETEEQWYLKIEGFQVTQRIRVM